MRGAALPRRAGGGGQNRHRKRAPARGLVANAPYWQKSYPLPGKPWACSSALVRKIPAAHEALKRLDWDSGIRRLGLLPKEAGVIGLGKVGCGWPPACLSRQGRCSYTTHTLREAAPADQPCVSPISYCC